MNVAFPANRNTTPAARGARARLRVAFGPVTPGWGSWEWVGADLQRELAGCFDSARFGWNEFPECDVAVIVKHLPPAEAIERLARRAAVVYAPVDAYGSQAEIAADATGLRRCARIVVHCERLRPYFEPFAPVTYMDHHLKFASREMAVYPSESERGFILWAGVRSNLPPLVEWVNRYGLDLPLVVLTNLEQEARSGGGREQVIGDREQGLAGGAERGQVLDDREQGRVGPRSGRGSVPTRSVGTSGEKMGADVGRELAAMFGFAAGGDVRVENWSARRQRELTATAMAAIDIKGDDFRARHKPPAKAIDFIASGLPLAMNDSSGAEHLARIGFDVASPLDAPRWFSRAYREETVAFGRTLRERLSLRMVGMRWSRLVEEVGSGERGEEVMG